MTITQETIQQMYDFQEPLPVKLVDYGFGQVEEVNTNIPLEVKKRSREAMNQCQGEMPTSMAFGEYLYQ